VADALRAHPELALFLTLAIGYGLGRLRIGPVRMNLAIGVLLAGIVVGQSGVEVPATMQWTFFVLFLFSTGFKSGPQFFRSLGRESLAQVFLTLLLCGTSLGCALLLARNLGLDVGGGAGLLAGSMNASAAVGTAGDEIAKLPVDETTRSVLAGHLSVVFAVTYLVGLVAELGVLSWVGPWLMRVDLASECRKLEAKMGIKRQEPGVISAYQEMVARAYGIPKDFSAASVAALERAFEPRRVFVERVRTTRGLVDPEPGMALGPGDVVVLSARREVLVGDANPLRGNEVEDRALLDIPTVHVDVVLTRREFDGRALSDALERLGKEDLGRSVFVKKLTRAGEAIPVGLGTILERGDVLTLVGTRSNAARVADRLGAALWPSAATDMITVAAAITIGGLIGLPTIHLMGLDIGLSVPVGVLLGGLVVGWLRSIRPAFGRVPEPALWIFDSLGLTGFLAIVGIGAGPGFIGGVRSAGMALMLAGVAIRLVPNVITMAAGRYLLRMHPGVLLGVCAGAGSSSAGLAAVNARADSSVPTLGYGVSYAVASVLLALGGTVIVVALAE
jgi:putative transport protein